MITLKHTNFGEAPDFQGSFESGLILIKGVSGRGKSTLFKALLFCLYGDLKVKSARPGCVVEVTIAASQLRVRRQKKSERLQVWWGPNYGAVADSNQPLPAGASTRYAEDAEAQAIIEQVLGSKQQYLLTSYIPQGAFNLFFESSASDRLTLLENVLGREVPIETWLNHLANQKQQITTCLETLANQKRTLDQATVAVVSSQHYRDSSQIEQLQTDLGQNYYQLAQEEAEAVREAERDRHRDQLTATLAGLTEVTLPSDLLFPQESLTTAITRLNSQRASLMQDQATITKQLQDLPKWAHSQALSRQRSVVLEQFNAILATLPAGSTRLSPTEITSGLERLKQEANLAATVTKLGITNLTKAQLVSLLPQWQQNLLDLATLNKHQATVTALQQQLSSYPEQALEDLVQQQANAVIAEQTQTCPDCGATVVLQNSKLVKVTGPVLTQAELVRRESQRAQQINLARQRQHLLNQLAGLQAQILPPQPVLLYSASQTQEIVTALKPFMALLSQSSYPWTAADLAGQQQLNQLTSQLAQLDQQLSQLGSPPQQQVNSAELTARLEQLSQTVATIDHNLTILSSYHQTKVRRETLLDQLAQIPPSDPDRNYRSASLTEQIQQANYQLNQAKAYNNYAQWAGQMATLQQQQQDYSLHSQAIAVLEKEIVTAEYLYVDQLLASLNGLLADIVAKLFEETISVELQAFRPLKSGKKLKPVLHLHIVHNGFEKDDIREVSFGMAHRISLAFTLALSRLLGKSFLILDEVGVSLNSVAKEAMLEVLRQYGPNLVLITEHGTLEGVFDQVIDLGDIIPVV